MWTSNYYLYGRLYQFQKICGIQIFSNYVLLHSDYTMIMLSVQIPKIVPKTTTKHDHFWWRLNLDILKNVPNHRGVKKLILRKYRFATFKEDLCFTCCPLYKYSETCPIDSSRALNAPRHQQLCLVPTIMTGSYFDTLLTFLKCYGFVGGR